MVGGVEIHKAGFDDTLLDVARRFGMGIEEMQLANPGATSGSPVKAPKSGCRRASCCPPVPGKGS